MNKRKHKEPESESQWFGFQKVTPEEKTRRVLDVFASVADSYDLMNDLMSGGMHRLWKNKFIRCLRPRHGEKLLDLAGGTGDIAFRFLKSAPETQVTVCDINPEMLKVGKKRAIDHGILGGIKWVEGNAETLPFPDNSFDAVTISFGLRNVTHIDKALCDIFRVLKPGGRFFCLEFSHVDNSLLERAYNLFSFKIIPKIGALIAKDRDSYQYLVESIRQFPDQEALAARMKKAGFERVRHQNLTGGIAAIHSGLKL